jgi:hypothetical protein
MKVFISWSKDGAKDIALSLHEWLPKTTLGQVKTWCSADPKCLPQGSGFGNKILEASYECDACLVVLTKENLSGWWTNFESGLFFGQKKKVYAILCGDLTHAMLGSANHPLSVNGVNYTSMEEDSIAAFLTSLKSDDRDWIANDFKNPVSQNFHFLKMKYDNVFGDDYKKISSLLSKNNNSSDINM